MAVAKRGGSSSEGAFFKCYCYKVASLTRSILGASEISSLKDQYVLGQQLGWGQFGVIRECTRKLTGEIFACKSIPKDRLVTEEDVRSIKLEIEIMTRLSGHPNVVGLKAVYEDEEYVHLVMELCAGGELFNQLEKHGSFSEADARVLFRQLIQVVMYCRDNGVVHRDLKPENILLATKDSSSPIKLADFGLATYVRPGKNLHGTVGSPFYIAPEVLSREYNEAADVWSSGVILYILLSGIPPFWGKTKSRIFDAVRAADLRFPSDPWDRISYSAKELIRGMLCTDPCKRLRAKQVLDHPWVMESTSSYEVPEFTKQNCEGMDLKKVDCSLMPRSEDVSFGAGMPIFGASYSPAVTCRSSFSTFLVDQSTVGYESAVFSFSSSGGFGTRESAATPVVSMSSFAFYSSNCVFEQGNSAVELSVNTLRVESVDREVLGKLARLPSELVQKAVNIKNGQRMTGIQSRRNHTIGLGDLEQLDLMVTESVIRWASCTQLSSATSLRLSLVC